MYFQLLVGGLAIGFVYAMVAVGINLLFNASGMLNFAEGEFVMIAAFVMYTLAVTEKVSLWLALFITIAVMVVFGLGFEKLVATPLRRRRAQDIFTIIATLALSIFLREFARVVWGTQPRAFPNVFGKEPMRLAGSIVIMPHTLWILGTTTALIVLLQLFFTKSKQGVALRATAQNRLASTLMGVNVDFMVRLTFVLNGILAALAGVLLSPVLYVTPDMSAMIAIKAFASAIIGGFGNTFGALVGGALLGIAETLGAAFISSRDRDAITFGLLVIFLLFRPGGLFKVDVSEKV